ncbi:MAG TPA: hypothetical protein DER01_17860 [Phycisphaerales bacterium]|nr:hypothetical protein [Phycisphaerales bacterium]
MSEPERIDAILSKVIQGIARDLQTSTAMGPAAAGAKRKPSEGARPGGEAEDTKPAGKGPIEAGGSEPLGELATGGRSVDATASISPDLDFAQSVLPLLIQSAHHAGYTQIKTHEEQHCIKVLLLESDMLNDPLIVTLGRCRAHQYQPNRRRWSIPNRPRWRRSFCHLQDKMFKGCVPGWLRPGCTSCGRIIEDK